MNRRDFLTTATASATVVFTGCNDSNREAIDYSKHPQQKDSSKKTVHVNRNKKIVIKLATS